MKKKYYWRRFSGRWHEVFREEYLVMLLDPDFEGILAIMELY